MMGTRAFVARQGWKETPIGLDEWVAAVSRSADLELHQSPDGELIALLRGSRRRRVTWHDGYLAAHHTNVRMAEAVFALAERLHADVYSDGRHRYGSLAEWKCHARLPGQQEARALSVASTMPTSSASWFAWLAVAAGFAFLVMAS
jgi:hypothetical protein